MKIQGRSITQTFETKGSRRFSIKARSGLFFPVSAFLIPLIVRSIPEALSWPYPIGFDTLIYAGNILKNGYLSWGLTKILGSSSLFYLVASAVNVLTGNPILSMKLLGPVLSATLCAALYAYGRRVLTWAPSKAFMVSALAGTYFVSLRISWDMYRQMLGSIFLLAALVALRSQNWKQRFSFVALAGTLLALSHELACVLFIAIVAAKVLEGRASRNGVFLFMTAVPALLIFIYQAYNPTLGVFLLPSETILSDNISESFMYISSFFLYMFLPLLPLAVCGISSLKELDLWCWLSTGLIFSYLPVVAAGLEVVAWFRWGLLTVYPVLFLSVEGFDRLARYGKGIIGEVSAGKAVALSVLFVSLFLSGYYLTSAPDHQIKYFGEWNNYKLFIQTSMLQNSVSLNDTPYVIEAFKWLDGDAEENMVLVLQEAMDNWAGLIAPRLTRIRINETSLSSPNHESAIVSMDIIASRKAAEGRDVYTVWWVDGKGWYQMPSPPSRFTEVRRFGDVGVYVYSIAG